MGRLIAALLLIGTTFGGFFFLRSEDVSLKSPVPKVFGISKSPIVNKWFPKTESLTLASTSGLTLSAKSAILVDFDTQEVIFQKDPQQKLPVASTVKIMTALLALENTKPSDIYVVSEKAAKVGENSMGLTTGERLSREELLYGLMLVSGNDAAVALAEGIAGSEEAFVAMMNEKTNSLGLFDTQFINASGLDEDGRMQYSTAYDMATIAHFIWQNYPEFREVSSAEHKFIEANSYHKAFDLYNDTNLLTTYPGVKGIKPGFTWEAGLCLVTYAENDGKKLLAVILGSDDRRGEMKELLDYGFGKYGIKVDHPALDL